MKYKKWWMPAVFSGISAIWLVLAYLILPLFFQEDSWAGLLYVLIGMGLWFFLLLPMLSLIYTRKIIADCRERFLLTLYNSALIVLPFAVHLLTTGFDSIALFWILLALVWTEMWALLGLSGKGEKKADVWYVPIFIAVAVLPINIYFRLFFTSTVILAVLSCVICPIAIAIYARVCVRDRQKRVLYTVYSSLLVFASTFGYTVYSIVHGNIDLGDSVWGIIRLVLSAIGTFILYELAALIGAGVKIKLPKRKKKPNKEEMKTEALEVTEETKE